GNRADARLIAEDTLERAVQLGTGFSLAIALAARANVVAYAGLPDEARRAAHEALAIFERGSCLAVTVWPAVTLGFLEISVGDCEAAAATLGPLAAAAAAMGYGEPTAAPFAPDAVEALIGVGRLEEAAALTDQLESNGRRRSVRAARAFCWPPPVPWTGLPRLPNVPSSSTSGCPCRSSAPAPCSSSARSSAAGGASKPPPWRCGRRRASSASSARHCGPVGHRTNSNGSTSTAQAVPVLQPPNTRSPGWPPPA